MHIHRPLLPFNGIELDKVSEEFLDYQNMSKDEIPKDYGMKLFVMNRMMAVTRLHTIEWIEF